MLSDAHCHLDHLVDKYEQPEQLRPIVEEARQAGLELIITCGTDLENSRLLPMITDTYNAVYCTVGWYPWWIKDMLADVTLGQIEELVGRHRKVLGIGEVGLDFEQNPSTMEEQKQSLRSFVSLAREVKLPLNLHCRPQHYNQLVKILQEGKAQDIGGMIHGFQGDEASAKEFLRLGFYLSLGHFLFWPDREAAQEAVTRVPLDRIVIETDSPVGPEPGTPGRPALLKGVAERVAALLGMPVERLAEISSKNLRDLYSARLGAA